MHKIFYFLFISIISILILSCSSSAEIGKLFTSEKANQLYGPALQSQNISLSRLSQLLSKTEKTIMFGIINEQLIILDGKRNLLYPEKAEYKDTDVFTAYSISRVKELLWDGKTKEGDDDNVSIDQRKEVLSVTFGEKTLESGIKCPPMCE